MNPKTKRNIFNIARIAICLAALWFVVQGVTLHDTVTLKDGSQVRGLILQESDPVRIRAAADTVVALPHSDIAQDEDGALQITLGLRSAIAQSNPSYLMLAIAIYFVVIFPQAVRLKLMLQAQEIRISHWESLKLSFAGNFLNFAAPLGSNAGDVFKAYFLALHTDKKTEAVTTIVLDRLVGMGSMFIVVALIVATVSAEHRIGEFRPYVLTAVGVGLAIGIVYLSGTWRRLLPSRWIARLPLIDHVKRIDRTAHTLARHYVILFACFLLTVLLQAMAMGAYFCVAVAVGLDAGRDTILEYYAYFYTGAFIQALPGPPQGLGTVELAYRYFLAPFGSPSQIVCVAFLIRIMVLVCALPGLWVTLTGAYKPARSAQSEDVVDDGALSLAGDGPACERSA